MEQRAGWYWLWVLQPHNRTPGCIPKSATFTFRPRVKQWDLCWLISWPWHYEGYQNKAKEISLTVILVISPQTQCYWRTRLSSKSCQVTFVKVFIWYPENQNLVTLGQQNWHSCMKNEFTYHSLGECKLIALKTRTVNCYKIEWTSRTGSKPCSSLQRDSDVTRSISKECCLPDFE